MTPSSLGLGTSNKTIALQEWLETESGIFEDKLFYGGFDRQDTDKLAALLEKLLEWNTLDDCPDEDFADNVILRLIDDSNMEGESFAVFVSAYLKCQKILDSKAPYSKETIGQSATFLDFYSLYNDSKERFFEWADKNPEDFVRYKQQLEIQVQRLSKADPLVTRGIRHDLFWIEKYSNVSRPTPDTGGYALDALRNE